MASKQIDVNVNGKDNTAGAFNSTSANIRKLGQEASKAGSTVGSSIGSGASRAASSISALGSTASQTFSTIRAGAQAASASLGDMGSAMTSLMGGFTAASAASMAWTGASQRQFNEMYLGTKMSKEAADGYLNTISQIVAQVPGDDTWMNSLLTGALAKETSLSADMLGRLGTAASKYVTAAQQTGASILPANAERELTSYIKSGNTGLMVRDGLLKNHIEDLEKAKTPAERILALEKAMTEEGYLQLDTASLVSSKWETIKGQLQLAATNVGMKLLPYVEKVLDFIMDLDEATNGWSTTIAFVGAALLGLAIAIAPIVTATAAAALAMMKYRKDAQAAAVANALNKGPALGPAGAAPTGLVQSVKNILWTVIPSAMAGFFASGGGIAGIAGAVTSFAASAGATIASSVAMGFSAALGPAVLGLFEEGSLLSGSWDFWESWGPQADQIKKDFGGIGAYASKTMADLGTLGGAVMGGLNAAWNGIRNGAISAFNGISGAWSGLKSYIGGGITGTVRAVQNTFSGVYSAAANLYNYVRNGATGLVRILSSGISSVWSSVVGLYNTVRQGATGVVTTIRNFIGMGPAGPARGPAGPLDDMSFRYESYGGAMKNAWTGANSMSGNCVDMTEGLINKYGGSMVEGTWNGGAHVWWKSPGGKEYDPARKAINNTFSPPPRGPSGGNGAAIVINGDVYGFDDFQKKVEQANNRLVVGVF